MTADDNSVARRSHHQHNGPGARIHLIRHGETDWVLTGQHTGKTDIDLTARGEEQALALKPVLSAIRFNHVFTSPALRARRTCELAGFSGAAIIDVDFAEWDYGGYEGKRSSDIRKGRPDWNVFRDGCPGGESVLDVTARADRVVGSLLPLSGNVLVFTHGQFGCCLAARWIGIAIAEARHLQMDVASISVLGSNPDHVDLAVIAHWNSTPALFAPQPQVPKG